MDRIQEYVTLLRELEETPPALEFTVQRAKARARRSRRGRLLGIPVAGLGGMFAVFVLLVNTWIPFAMACGEVPVLKELAAAVAFSPSLRTALEHDYIQYVGQRQIVDGLTLMLDYAVSDRRQVNLFYHFEGEGSDKVQSAFRIESLDGTPLPPNLLSAGGALEFGEVGRLTAEFVDSDTPAGLMVVCRAERLPSHSNGQTDPIGHDTVPGALPEAGQSVFTFELRLDPEDIAQGVNIPIGRWLELDSQRILVEEAEIYPTHLRVELGDAPENAAWLKGLQFYLEDETGRRTEPISNGVSAAGSGESPFMSSIHQESVFFWDSESLTLHITGAQWLEKDRQYVTVDLRTGQADWMPEGTRLTVEREGDMALFTVRISPEAREGEGHRQIMDWEYLDPEGGVHRFNSMAATMGSGADEDCYLEQFRIPVYQWEAVRLKLVASRWTQFETPVSVPLHGGVDTQFP